MKYHEEIREEILGRALRKDGVVQEVEFAKDSEDVRAGCVVQSSPRPQGVCEGNRNNTEGEILGSPQDGGSGCRIATNQPEKGEALGTEGREDLMSSLHMKGPRSPGLELYYERPELELPLQRSLDKENLTFPDPEVTTGGTRRNPEDSDANKEISTHNQGTELQEQDFGPVSEQMLSQTRRFRQLEMFKSIQEHNRVNPDVQIDPDEMTPTGAYNPHPAIDYDAEHKYFDEEGRSSLETRTYYN